MDGSGEILTIFIGQAGTQLANACWELFCLEHGVSPNGCLRQGYYPTDPTMCAFFSESQVRKLTPRTMIIDLEPSVIDEIKTGDYKQLFSPDSLITGKQDASNNYARGYYTIGREAIPLVLSRISKMWEACSKPVGFIVFRSISGGTGSGFASLLLQQLSADYPKTITLDFVIYPSPNISAVIVEPYNALFSTHSSLDHVDCSFLVDNEALYNICASVTASMRFESAVNVSLQELQTNLVPYPRIHFSLTTYAPLISPRRGLYAEITTQRITNDCFVPSNQMLSIDPRIGAYTSCCLLYRGDVSANDVNRTIASLKGAKSIRFVTWSPTGFKVGINYQPTTTVPGGDLAKSNRTVVMISNNTAMRHRWSMLTRKYDLMYQKRAFFHHYIGEGMEEDFFKEAREDMMTLINDYKEIEK